MILKSVSRSGELTSELSDKACFSVSASIGRIGMMFLSDSDNVKDVKCGEDVFFNNFEEKI